MIGGLKSCFSLMGKYKYMYWITMVLDVSLAYCADVLFALLNKGVINSVTAGDFSAFTSSIWLGVAAILVYMVNILDRYFNMRSIRYIMLDMRRDLFKHMEFLSVEYYEKNHSADSIFRLNSNVENMKRAYTGHFPNIFQGVAGGLASCIFILVMDVRLGVISLATCALTIIVNVKFAEPLRKLGGKIQRLEADLLGRLSDLVAGFRVIKLYDTDGSVINKYGQTNKKTSGLRVKRIKKIGTIDSISHLLNFINTFVLITIGAVMAAKGFTDFGTVFAILTVQGNVSGMLLNFGSAWGMLQESIAASELIHEVLDTDVEERQPTMDPGEDTSDHYIAFENVKFAYDSESGNVLDGLNLSVRKGTVAALVGPSGGGKSTVIKLLPEFYPIHHGKIYFGGRNIESYSADEIRNTISYVPQDAYLFDASVKENIGYGKPNATDDEIIAAAKAANAHEFILDLSDGYDTMVGERGFSLSGGQRQRIAIARAFLKNAPVLLLDEATSALDNENEAIVQNSVEALMKNRTVIVIAHRLSTIEKADIIYVIEHGKVVQLGTHEDLKQQDGTYAELVRLSDALK